MKIIETPREELLRLLATHDWTYDRSDDSRYYQAGRTTHLRILDLMKVVPDGAELYRIHCPFGV